MARIKYFKMRARDGNAAELEWRYWTVMGQPDLDGQHYVGPFAGSQPNLQEIVIASQWEVRS